MVIMILTEKITNDWPDNVSVFSNRVETYQAITKDGDNFCSWF